MEDGEQSLEKNKTHNLNNDGNLNPPIDTAEELVLEIKEEDIFEPNYNDDYETYSMSITSSNGNMQKSADDFLHTEQQASSSSSAHS